MVIKDEQLKVEYPGLLREPLRSGGTRFRVRPKGDKQKRVTLPFGPGHKDFKAAYDLARSSGMKWESEKPAAIQVTPYTVSWLTYKYLHHFEEQCKTGAKSLQTLKKRRQQYARLRDAYGKKELAMPRKAVIALRDKYMSTPAAANDLIEAIRTMYDWAVEREYVEDNPAKNVKRIYYKEVGAVSWTMDDITQFKARHPLGTTPYLALTILVFTACRIGCLRTLGRKHIELVNGRRVLSWLPEKRGSTHVTLPIAPQLQEAIDALKIVSLDKPFLINGYGDVFKTTDSLGQTFRKWCRQAGLGNRSAHGVRKGAGSILAHMGCSQYQIMSVHGHSEAKTSEKYTKGVERYRLASDAIDQLKDMEW